MQAHCGGVASLSQSPFVEGLLLSAGGWDWAIWHDDRLQAPLMRSRAAPVPYTCTTWSPTRPSECPCLLQSAPTRAFGNV